MNIFSHFNKKVVFFPLMAVGILLLASCQPPDGAVTTSRSEYYHNDSGYVLHLKNKKANYKYKLEDLKKYEGLVDGLKDAVKEINRFSSLDFSQDKVNRTSGYDFVINISEYEKKNSDGTGYSIMENNFTYNNTNGELYASTITIYLPTLRKYYANQHDIKLLFMHEFGHTLGLKHVKAESKYNPANKSASLPSIMYPIYSGWDDVESYTALDQEVILSVYEGYYA